MKLEYVFIKQNELVKIAYKLEKATAPHSSTLAWKIRWTEEPGGLQSMGLWRVWHDWATSLSLSRIGEGKATHSRVLAWRIPGTGEPGGLPSTGSHRVGHYRSNLAAAAAAYKLLIKWRMYIANRLHSSIMLLLM